MAKTTGASIGQNYHKRQRKKVKKIRLSVSAFTVCVTAERTLLSQLVYLVLNPSVVYMKTFDPLTTAQNTRVDAALSLAGHEEEYLTRGLMRHDFRMLRPGRWLNDKVVDDYIKMISQRAKDEPLRYPDLFCYGTKLMEWYNKKADGDYMAVRTWNRKNDIFAKDLVFIPYHCDGNHWILMVVRPKAKKLFYFDSLKQQRSVEVDAVKRFLCDEFDDKKKANLVWAKGNEKPNPGEWTVHPARNIPRQCNTWDCGIYTILYAEYLSREERWDFHQRDIAYFRRRIAIELLEGRIFQH
ncbi:hypothetical protein HDV00_007190 [Rhizophlyctis rosea]|nr:hypothetical protein HDV00_007190 [Rhizophlyctis rosea]